MSKWIPVLVIEDDELVRIELKRALQLYDLRFIWPRTDQPDLNPPRRRHQRLFY